MIVKVHTHQDGKVLVSVVDKDLLGKKFEEGDLQIDLTGDFYRGDERSLQEIGDLLRNADLVNLVGENAVTLGIEEEVVDKHQIKHIQDIPVAMAVLEKGE